MRLGFKRGLRASTGAAWLALVAVVLLVLLPGPPAESARLPDSGEPRDPVQQGSLGNPTNLWATLAGAGRVRLTWQPARNASHHWIWSVKANGTDGKWIEASGGADSAVIVDLESGQTYWFMVLAGGTVNGAPVWSQWSNRVDFLIAHAGSTERFTAISAGVHHTCGVKADGTVACWGRDNDGQATPPSGRFQSVSAGEDYTCGVKQDGELDCWGLALYGRVSPPGGRFVQVSAGHRLACGLRESGSISCWGDEYDGSEIMSNSQYASVTTGGVFFCGVRVNGTAACGSRNFLARGQPPGGRYKSISSGVFHSCGVRDDDTLACWDNTQTDGPIIYVTDHGQSSPPSGKFDSVSSGELFSCGVRQDDGGISCWGRSNYGQTAAPTGSFAAVSAGGAHACGLRRDGSVECWGYDEDGRLEPPQGEETVATSSTPNAPTARATGNVGGMTISWDQVQGAQYYTVGWINWTKAKPLFDAGEDWLSLFHYTTILGDETSYTVNGLTGGEDHYAIIRATDVATGRFGEGYSEWSAWSSTAVQPASAPQPMSEEVAVPGPPTASAECYVGQQLTPGQSCWFQLSPRDDVSIFAVTSGGPYHGWGQVWRDDWFRFFREPVSQSKTVDGVRHRFAMEKQGSSWVIVQYGPDS